MKIISALHIGNDFVGLNAALLDLDDKLIEHIFALSLKAKEGQTISEFFNIPTLGNSELFDEDDSGYFDTDKLTQALKDLNVFKEGAPEDTRSDVVELHVGKTDFYFEGVFKHTDTHWETRLIPLTFLISNINLATKKKPNMRKPDLNMTVEQMNAIHEKIAQGANHGLNAHEIEATFNRHVTKAQLIRCIVELIQRN
jgi:hypothetical protein